MYNKKVKILLIIIISFLLTHGLINNAFFSTTPRINKSFFVSLIQEPINFVYGIGNVIVKYAFSNKKPVLSQTQQQVIQKLQNLPISTMQKVSKNSYAYTDNNTGINYIRLTSKNEYLQKSVLINGQQVNIQIPK